MSLPLKQLDPPVTDGDLAAQAAAGDAEALGELYRRHAGGLGQLAVRLLGSRTDAEDLVQDLFVGLPEALLRYREDGRLEGWLRRVAVNLALKRLRRVRRRREANLSDGLAWIPSTETWDHQILRRAVDALPDKLRTVVILRLVAGYSHQEIGELLGITRGASEVRLSRALDRLRWKLGGQDVY